jgi:ADP-ribose pyrophosphatase
VEKKLASHKAYAGRIVSVRVDDVELPSGRQTTREVVERPDTVAVLAVDDEKRILAVKQPRYVLGRETIEIPAGTIDAGETAEQAALRELREETGFTANHIEPLLTYGPAIGYCTEQMTVFFARSLEQAPLEGDEDTISTLRLPFDDAYASILAGKQVFFDSKSMLAVLLARARGLL